MTRLKIGPGVDPNTLAIHSNCHITTNWNYCGANLVFMTHKEGYWKVFGAISWGTLTNEEWICLFNRWANDLGELQDEAA